MHTGDMRAEPSFVESLKRNPFLAKYIAPDPKLDFRNMSGPSSQDECKDLYSTLEAIYLDTACLTGTVDIPNKVRNSIPFRGQKCKVADSYPNLSDRRHQ